MGELAASLAKIERKPWTFTEIIGSLDPADRDALLAAIDDPTKPTAGIHQVLVDAGYKVELDSVGRWRRRRARG